MIEEFKSLQNEDTISFTNNQVVDFTQQKEMTITGLRNYCLDEDNEMIVVEMDEYYLVAHNFESEEKYFIYQLIDEGSTNDLEDEGYRFLNEEDDFRHKIIIRDEERTHIYQPSDTGAIYGLIREKDTQEVSICEFFSHSSHLTNILIEREDDYAYIMQGLEITEDDFSLE